MIRGSDGLDYEDLAARLLGEPAETARNRAVTTARQTGQPELAEYLAVTLPAHAGYYTASAATDAWFAGS